MIFLICSKPWTVHELFFLVAQSAAIALLVILAWLLQSRQHLSKQIANTAQNGHT
jgi:hypothetical protein